MKKIIIGLLIIIAIIVIVVLSLNRYGNNKSQEYDNKYSAEKIVEYNNIFQSKISNLNEVATNFNKDNVQSFCKVERDWYKVKASNYKIGQQEYIGSDNKKVSFEELLSKDNLTKDQFDYYKNIIDQNDFVECIKNDLNLKVSSNDPRAYSVTFQFGPSYGYIYVSDGSIVDNTNTNYKDRVFEQLERVGTSNWYKFKYKNPYGA